MEQSSASSVLPVVENAMEQEQYIQSEPNLARIVKQYSSVNG